MTFTDGILRHAVLAVIVITVLALLGLRAGLTLPLTHLPDIGDNRIVLRLTAPDASLTATDHDLAQPVYRALSSLPDVTSIRAQITSGQLVMTLSLRNSRTAQDSLAKVQDRLQALRPDLDLAVSIDEIRATSSRRQAALELAILPRDGDIVTASDALRDTILPTLRKIDGIAEIEVQGTARAELVIQTTDPQLASVGLTFAALNRQITQALSQQVAAQVAVSSVPTAGTILFSLPQNMLAAEAAQTLSALSLTTASGQKIPLAAVARVSTAPAPRDWLTRHNGTPAILAQIHAATGADLVTLSRDMDRVLTDLRHSRPDLALDVVARPAKQAIRSLGATRQALLEGCLLVIAVIALALKSWRATALAALAIPLSVLPTLYVMQVLGLSLNIVSLLALTLASGLVVDDAIVEIENIHTHQHHSRDSRKAVARAVDEMARPVIATSLALLAVFLPVATMPGEAGLYFQAFGYTLCIATVFSLLVSRLVIPGLALRFAGSPVARPAAPSARRLARRYRAVVIRALRLRWLCLAGAGLVAWLSVVSALNHPGAFIPLDRDALLRFDMALPPTMPPKARLDHLAALERDLLADKGVRGLTVIASDQPDDTLRLLIQTDGTAPIAARVRDALRQTADARALPLTSAGRPALVLDLAAPDRQSLEIAAPAILAAIAQLPEDIPILSPMAARQAQVRFLPDQGLLRQLDLSAADLVAALQGHAHPDDHLIARIEGDDQQPLGLRSRLVASSPDAPAPNDLSFAPVALPGGGTMPLAALGRFDLEFAHLRLDRRDGLYVLPLLAAPPSAASARRVTEIAEAEVARLSSDLPGLALLPAGDTASRRAMMSDLGRALGSMLLLLIAVLYALFRSMAQVGVILVSLVFALSGGMLVLSVTGLPVSLPVLIGLILLLGIVAKNAILLIDRAQTLVARHGNMAQAVIAAASDRARPIIMTSVAMIAGMLPAALPWLEGSAFRQPLALTVIGGVAVSTLLSLVVTPVLCLMAHGAACRIMRIAPKSKALRIAHA
ncbi:probable transporter transmembrane protein [Roseobacter sp. AzwK-3b]|uniref:efflux RND transporter permease subunit n=1 Tax=Roseobacter sp. AzwK-3b TaxID=351016 RepID=UPI000156ABAC|nr:efflux RND transporter permease subunit [Roseobacter sp. AzwK-3b]EDM69965.1 probable transporter transmembrane protein [Roseobacter sp. AzwK-3b]